MSNPFSSQRAILEAQTRPLGSSVQGKHLIDGTTLSHDSENQKYRCLKYQDDGSDTASKTTICGAPKYEWKVHYNSTMVGTKARYVQLEENGPTYCAIYNSV